MRARRVRNVESASWCGSWPWAVRMMNVSTPACSQSPSRSFIQRCSVLRRTAALPGNERRGGVDAVFDRRRAQDLEGRREVVGETLDDERVAAERQVGAVLLAGPHRHEEAGIALENETHLVGDKGLQVERRAHLALAGCAVV